MCRELFSMLKINYRDASKILLHQNVSLEFGVSVSNSLVLFQVELMVYFLLLMLRNFSLLTNVLWFLFLMRQKFPINFFFWLWWWFTKASEGLLCTSSKSIHCTKSMLMPRYEDHVKIAFFGGCILSTHTGTLAPCNGQMKWNHRKLYILQFYG